MVIHMGQIINQTRASTVAMDKTIQNMSLASYDQIHDMRVYGGETLELCIARFVDVLHHYVIE